MWLSVGVKKESLILSWILIQKCENSEEEPTFRALLAATADVQCEAYYGIKPERAAARARQIYRSGV